MNSIYSIKKSEFREIYSTWQNQLWPGRQSPIEAVSCIDEAGNIDILLKDAKPYFWKIDDAAGEVAAVISGHGTSEISFRSRGLWVREDLRGQGLAHQLMKHLASEALRQGYQKVWTMPRSTSWYFYERFGFQKRTQTQIGHYEFGPHYLADFDLKGFEWI